MHLQHVAIYVMAAYCRTLLYDDLQTLHVRGYGGGVGTAQYTYMILTYKKIVRVVLVHIALLCMVQRPGSPIKLPLLE